MCIRDRVGPGQAFALVHLGVDAALGLLSVDVVPGHQPGDAHGQLSVHHPYLVHQGVPARLQQQRRVDGRQGRVS